MNYYFKLQYQRLLRTSSDNGSNFYLGLLVILTLFSLGSVALVHYFEWASLVYLILQLILLNIIGNRAHFTLLAQLFEKKEHFKIRIIENFIFALPFLVFFMIYNEMQFALMSIIFSLILAVSKGFSLNARPIPTPFPKRPFEFTSGFRLNWLFIVLVTTVSIIALIVDNVNLGVVCVFLSNLLCIRAYAIHEPKEILWLSNSSPASFLIQKMWTGIFQSLVLTLPFAVTLAFFYPEMALIILIAESLGLLYIVTALLAKYAFYPDETSLTGGFMLAFSILLPPALVITIPYLYTSAKSNLDPILK